MVRSRLAHFGLLARTLASLALLAAPWTAQAAARTLAIADMRAIVDLEQPAISPDGTRVAVIVRRGERSALVLVTIAGGAQTTVARGGEVADPRWSPDGSTLAYLQQDRPSGHMQLFAEDSHGVRQLTHSRSDVIDMAWRPGGAQLAFAAAVAIPDPGFFDAADNDYTATSPTAPIHLWLISAAGGAARELTHGSWTLAPTDSGGIFAPQFVWSRDGERIVFTRVANTLSGDDEYSTLWELDVAAGRLRKLTGHTRLELSPSFSPDGSKLLYWYARSGNYLAFNTLRLRDGKTDTDVTAHFDFNAGGALWMPDGRALLVCANHRTKAQAWLLSLDGRYQQARFGRFERRVRLVREQHVRCRHRRRRIAQRVYSVSWYRSPSRS